MTIDLDKLRQAVALAREAAPGCSVDLSVHARSQEIYNSVASGLTDAHTVLIDHEEFDCGRIVPISDGGGGATLYGPRRERARGAA